MQKIVIAGFRGKMGATATKMVLEQPDFELVGVLDPNSQAEKLTEYPEYSGLDIPIFTTKETLVEHVQPDVWIDFTTPNFAFEHTAFALKHRISPVVGTTGITDDQLATLKQLAEQSQVGGLVAPNFAIGAVLMMEFAQKAVQYFPDVEIIELHHDQKLDAPSGTAIKTAELMAQARSKKMQGAEGEKETIAGARGADFEGMRIHSVRLPGLVAHQQVQFGGSGEGLTLRHDSYDRRSFMTGVALACRKITNEKSLIYGLEHLL